MNGKTMLKARDIERLENTSIATALGGAEFAAMGPSDDCTGVCCSDYCFTVNICSIGCTGNC